VIYICKKFFAQFRFNQALGDNVEIFFDAVTQKRLAYCCFAVTERVFKVLGSYVIYGHFGGHFGNYVILLACHFINRLIKLSKRTYLPDLTLRGHLN